VAVAAVTAMAVARPVNCTRALEALEVKRF